METLKIHPANNWWNMDLILVLFTLKPVCWNKRATPLWLGAYSMAAGRAATFCRRKCLWTGTSIIKDPGSPKGQKESCDNASCITLLDTLSLLLPHRICFGVMSNIIQTTIRLRDMQNCSRKVCKMEMPQGGCQALPGLVLPKPRREAGVLRWSPGLIFQIQAPHHPLLPPLLLHSLSSPWLSLDTALLTETSWMPREMREGVCKTINKQ